VYDRRGNGRSALGNVTQRTVELGSRRSGIFRGVCRMKDRGNPAEVGYLTLLGTIFWPERRGGPNLVRHSGHDAASSSFESQDDRSSSPNKVHVLFKHLTGVTSFTPSL
jgi:hypothetical protein